MTMAVTMPVSNPSSANCGKAFAVARRPLKVSMIVRENSFRRLGLQYVRLVVYGVEAGDSCLRKRAFL